MVRVDRDTRCLIVEGLFLAHPPTTISAHLDYIIGLGVGQEELKRRMIERKIRTGRSREGTEGS